MMLRRGRGHSVVVATFLPIPHSPAVPLPAPHLLQQQACTGLPGRCVDEHGGAKLVLRRGLVALDLHIAGEHSDLRRGGAGGV